MDIKLKKRLVGFLLLVGIVLIIIPLLFGRSIPADELKLSGHVPSAPDKPQAIEVPIPPQAATVPAIATNPPPKIASAEAMGAFEPAQTVTKPVVNNATAITPTVKASASSVPLAVKPIVPPASLPAATSNLSAEPVVKPLENPPLAKTSVLSKPASTAVVAVTPSPSLTKAAEKNTEKHTKEVVAPIKTPAKKTAYPLASATKAWSVQLGSFTAKANAEKLLKKLQAKGFSAYLRSSKTAKGEFIRVLAGPPLSRSEAEQLQQRLQKELNLASIIVKEK